MTQYNNQSMTRSPRKRRQGMDTTAKVLLVAFVVIGIILAIIGGKFIFNLVRGWSLTDLPGAPVGSSDGTNTGGEVVSGIPLQSASGPAGVAWDGKSRINILLLGLDYSTRRQADDQGSPLSDTMILVTVDPMTSTIGVMSIRRDLWVNLSYTCDMGGNVIEENYGYGKINSAYKLGQDYHGNPGECGGPGAAMATVQNLLGVPINYYARVEFDAFKKVIDEIGGIYVTLQQPMLLDWKGDGNKFWIYPNEDGSPYVMPGSYALAYARTRDQEYGDGDIARGNRQMEVIGAIRDRILNLSNLPNLVARAPVIYSEISSGVQTNMSLDQAIKLAYLMMQIPRENMTMYNIDYTVASPETTSDGIYIMRVMPDQLRILRDQMFTASGVAAAPIVMEEETGVDVSGDPLTLAITEGARIEVLNGTGAGGLAETTAAYLTSQGLVVSSTGNADLADGTTILYHSDTPYAIKYLATLMGVTNSRIYNQNDPNSAADVTVVLGNDWATTNPMQ